MIIINIYQADHMEYVLLKQCSAVASLLANGSAAFKWKLGYYWLKCCNSITFFWPDKSSSTSELPQGNVKCDVSFEWMPGLI